MKIPKISVIVACASVVLAGNVMAVPENVMKAAIKLDPKLFGSKQNIELYKKLKTTDKRNILHYIVNEYNTAENETERKRLLNLVEIIYEKLPDFIKEKDAQGMTPLDLAMEAAIKLDPKIFGTDNNMEAAIKLDPKIFGTDNNIEFYKKLKTTDSFNRNILHYIVNEYNKKAHDRLLKLVEIICEKLPDFIKEKDAQGMTPLHLASISIFHSTPMIKLLIENKADVNAKNNKGLTPIDLAYISNKPKNVIKILQDAGALATQKWVASYNWDPNQLLLD
jgi:ankyrin repeat protein